MDGILRFGSATALAALLLAGCASTAPPSGRLSSYEGLTERSGAVRTGVRERTDHVALAEVKRVFLAPTQIVDDDGVAWRQPEERSMLLREVDAQLCFEVTERYDLASETEADATVRAVVTRVQPTGRIGSLAAAATSWFVPGPIGLRAPGSLGALTVEAEMLAPDGAQLAAVTWNRAATAIGTDNPSLSRIGDALQFAEPFADTAAEVMTADGYKGRPVPKPDPCAAFGPRIRVGGFAAKAITGLYVPEAGAAKPAEQTSPEPETVAGSSQ